MYKLDIKDRKILYELDLNCRQSNAQIGKKVGLKRDVIGYRIKKLQDNGIIKMFYTVINAYKLGYHVFRFYLNFQYVTTDIKNKIIEYLVKDKRTWAVGSVIGRYDLSVVVWIKDFRNFYQFWEKMLDKYGDYFAKKIFSIYVQAFSYRQSFLLLNEYKKSDRLDYEIIGVGKTVKIDDLDYEILDKIALNARKPLVELAEELNSSSHTITYRIKNLIKLGVIQAFRVSIDLSKLELKHFKIDIYLKEHTQRKHIIDYIKYNPNLTFIATSAGVSDLELEFDLKDSNKLMAIMEDINSKFPGAIRNYDYFNLSHFYKVRCLPEI